MSHTLLDVAVLDQYAAQNPLFDTWRQGFGVIQHQPFTQSAAIHMAEQLVKQGKQPNVDAVYEHLIALDRLSSAGLWLVVHMTYAKELKLDGSPLAKADFKETPEGHTGGALNIVPAYASYLAWNALTGDTRSWMMGQGHCVAAIDALNVLTRNLHPEQAERYPFNEAGLAQLLQDFYGYEQAADGRPSAPLGSHVNPYTAGGISEGGYLGFAELQYGHMPLPGETLVTFLSDGAAEEQRGSDWIPRWWRAEDTGKTLPIMIANGRRIEQRTEMGTYEGLKGFMTHQQRCGFDPIIFDGTDPAAFVTTMFEMERRLDKSVAALKAGKKAYPLPIPYGIAETTKGYGFYGAGENAAHNLPLPANPFLDESARAIFNQHAATLWVSPDELSQSLQVLCQHEGQGRALERDHPLAARHLDDPILPQVPFHNDTCSPMSAVDEFFQGIVAANPQLRAKVGNPDELASNRLSGVLKALKHRVTDPESDLEAVDGKIITALNEEAVVSACLANKAGLNLVASYEAFCVKMLGAVRQELIFARHRKEIGRPAGWLGFPVIATSHTWENGKNEQSHQDTTFCEALLGEMSDTMRVLFPADHNSTLALLPSVYQARGQISCMVIPKQARSVYFEANEAKRLAQDGALVLGDYRGRPNKKGKEKPILLIATGSYQLEAVLRASERLQEVEQSHRVVYLQEPGRFRQPRDAWEEEVCVGNAQREAIFPKDIKRRVFVSHMRPEVAIGHLLPLVRSAKKTASLGYINRGGTLDVAGMLFANRCTWAHVLSAAAQVSELPFDEWLNEAEAAAVMGMGDPLTLR